MAEITRPLSQVVPGLELPGLQRQHNQNKYVPTDDTKIKKVHYPKQPFYPEGDEYRDDLADQHATQAPEVNGKVRNEWINLEPTGSKHCEGG